MSEGEPLAGGVCVVTGASSGIGLETARGLARLGAAVVMVGRDPERLALAARDVGESARGGRVSSLRADLASLSEVRALAARVAEAHPQVHVLVNNAGVWNARRRLTADGHEETFAVNHLAPYLLTRLLLPSLEAAGAARVVTVSSRLHERLRAFDFDDLTLERRYSGLSAYRRSKLANVMFASELARRLAGSGITSNSVHPGDVATRVVRSSRLLQWGLDTIARHFLATPEQGARTSIHVASAPELEGVSGRYFARCRERRPSPVANDREACARLWDLSAELTGL